MHPNRKDSLAAHFDKTCLVGMAGYGQARFDRAVGLSEAMAQTEIVRAEALWRGEAEALRLVHAGGMFFILPQHHKTTIALAQLRISRPGEGRNR